MEVHKTKARVGVQLKVPFWVKFECNKPIICSFSRRTRIWNRFFSIFKTQPAFWFFRFFQNFTHLHQNYVYFGVKMLKLSLYVFKYYISTHLYHFYKSTIFSTFLGTISASSPDYNQNRAYKHLDDSRLDVFQFLYWRCHARHSSVFFTQSF